MVDMNLTDLDRDNALIMLLRNQTAMMRHLDEKSLMPWRKSKMGWLIGATEEWLGRIDSGKRNQPLREPPPA